MCGRWTVGMKDAPSSDGDEGPLVQVGAVWPGGTTLSPMLRELFWTGRPQTPILDEASSIPWLPLQRHQIA